MRTYEITIALHPELGDAGVKEQIEKVQEILSANGGSVKQVAEWGLRDLAYPIKKEKRAVFYVVVFEGAGETVDELERQLRISDHILRYITVRVDPDRPPLDIGRPRRGPDEGEGEDAAPAAEAPAATAPASETPSDAGAAS